MQRQPATDPAKLDAIKAALKKSNYPDSEAQSQALDKALALFDSKDFMDSQLRREIQNTNQLLIQKTAQDLHDVNATLFCAISDAEMGTIADSAKLPLNIKKLTMANEYIYIRVAEDLLFAANLAEQKFKFERWLAILQRSFEIGDMLSAAAIFSCVFSNPAITKLQLQFHLSQNANLIYNAFMFYPYLNNYDVIENIFNNFKYADALMNYRTDAVIPIHAIYRGKLVYFHHSIEKLNQAEANDINELKLKMIGQSTSYQEKFKPQIDTLHAQNELLQAELSEIQSYVNDLPSTILSRVARFESIRKKLDVAAEDDVDKLLTEQKEIQHKINKLEKKLRNAPARKARKIEALAKNKFKFTLLFEEALKSLTAEEQQDYAKKSKQIFARYLPEKDRHQKNMDTIVRELNVKKQRLNKLLEVKSFNSFQGKVLLGISATDFQQLQTVLDKKSKEQVAANKKTEKETMPAPFISLIIPEVSPAISRISAINKLIAERDATLDKLKAYSVKASEENQPIFDAIINTVQSRLSLKEIVQFIVAQTRWIEQLIKSNPEFKEVYEALSKLEISLLKLMAEIEKLSSPNEKFKQPGSMLARNSGESFLSVSHQAKKPKSPVTLRSASSHSVAADISAEINGTQRLAPSPRLSSAVDSNMPSRPAGIATLRSSPSFFAKDNGPSAVASARVTRRTSGLASEYQERATEATPRPPVLLTPPVAKR